MADYWKSQARKYCDFCKCWIADNKPSVEFHEKGRRHQDNVAKKLKYISKKSRRDEKESVKVDAALKQMEAAALEAYRKDVENNADLSSFLINKKLEDNNLTINESGYSSERKIWKEAKSSDGRTYYRNELTNETVWTAPKDGFLSLADQRERLHEETKNQLKMVEKHRQTDARIRMQEQKLEDEEARAAAAREKMKDRRVAEEPEPVVSGPILPTGRIHPYGQWKTVETNTPTVDLQLPKQDIEYFQVPVAYEVFPTPKEFKEKSVESLGSGNTMFKKRKFGTNNKRNARQRLDDD